MADPLAALITLVTDVIHDYDWDIGDELAERVIAALDIAQVEVGVTFAYKLAGVPIAAADKRQSFLSPVHSLYRIRGLERG